jgi:hypothetical protein
MLPLALLLGIFVIVVVLCRPVVHTNAGRGLCALLVFALLIVAARVLAGHLPDSARSLLLIGMLALALVAVITALLWTRWRKQRKAHSTTYPPPR